MVALFESLTTFPGNTGAGYGKKQKLPSANTGIGSTFAMGWDTGIYPPPLPDEEDEDDIDIPFEDRADIRSFFTRINHGYVKADPSQRADRASYAGSSNKFSTIGLSEQSPMPVMKGMVPFTAKVQWPNGLGMATGGSSSEFGATTTSPGKVGGSGTQFGWSRIPLDRQDDNLRFMSIIDILNLPPDERNFLKQQNKIIETLTMVESLLSR